MKLKSNINCTNFLFQARKCRGDVFFCTPEGDRLNLKSILCEYIFITAAENPGLLKNGWVECVDRADEAVLVDYMEAKA